MINHRSLRAVLLGACALAAAATALAGCDTDDPTNAIVENTYVDGVVYKTWWVTTLFDEPVPARATSSELRSVPETGIAYALLAPGWDPASGTPPTSLIAVRSKQPLTAVRGRTLHISVSDATFTGQCSAKEPLTQDEADFITQRIFPAQFANLAYDAATCRSTPIRAGDAGADGGD
jgi:hypothetical protein